MSFIDVIENYTAFDFPRFFAAVTDETVARCLAKDKLGPMDFLTLLSPAAEKFLEPMAQKAHRLTVQYFGKTIQLFIPLYLSNYCTNHCLYCGFNHDNEVLRRKLLLPEIEEEARAIAKTGMQHVLLLTGESPRHADIDYLLAAATCLRRYFPSVSIEVYPLETTEYRQLQEAGVDGMTLFQETYDREVYARVHPAGRKRDYTWRLTAPERAAAGGIRLVNLGPLLGLAEPRIEVFFTGLHLSYLEDRFLDTEFAVSLPRINEAPGSFTPDYPIPDRTFVQFITALRLFLPRAGITISTRENGAFRDRLLPLGVTRYSAGSSTGVGGYARSEEAQQSQQFAITDERGVAEVAAAISRLGYQPVFKDWQQIL